MKFGRIIELGLTHPEAESPESKPGQSDQREEPSVDDEEAVLRQIEQRAKEQGQLSFLHLECNLDRALSDHALEEYRKAEFVFEKDSGLPFFRLTDLAVALNLLKKFKDQLPKRYQANVNKVLEREDAIKQIFSEYHALRQKGQGRDLADVAALSYALETLRSIDPGRFPNELVDLSEEELRQLELTKGVFRK